MKSNYTKKNPHTSSWPTWSGQYGRILKCILSVHRRNQPNRSGSSFWRHELAEKDLRRRRWMFPGGQQFCCKRCAIAFSTPSYTIPSGLCNFNKTVFSSSFQGSYDQPLGSSILPKERPLLRNTFLFEAGQGLLSSNGSTTLSISPSLAIFVLSYSKKIIHIHKISFKYSAQNH